MLYVMLSVVLYWLLVPLGEVLDPEVTDLAAIVVQLACPAG